MRYQVGEKLIVAFFKFEGEKGIRWFSMPYLYHEKEIEQILLKELEVTEHHAVSWEYDIENKTDHDGYVLKDKDGNFWNNQFPKASYGQTSCEADFRFRRVLLSGDKEASVPDFLDVDNRLLTQVYDDIYTGIVELPKRKNPPTQLIEKLTELKERLEKQLAEEFKKKFVSEPIWPEHPDVIRWKLQNIQEGE